MTDPNTKAAGALRKAFAEANGFNTRTYSPAGFFTREQAQAAHPGTFAEPTYESEDNMQLSPIEQMRGHVADFAASIEDIQNRAQARADGKLLASESRALATAREGHAAAVERLAELEEMSARRAASEAAMRSVMGTSSTEVRTTPLGSVRAGGTYTTAVDPYSDGRSPHSFFSDLVSAKRGDPQAAQRVFATNEARSVSTATGSAGSFAPPAWLVEDYIAKPRGTRVFADLWHQEALPPGHSSVNVPRISTGTLVDIQSAENTALANRDLVSDAVSSTVVTIGGRVVTSLQMLLQGGGGNMDKVVFSDLLADYGQRLELETLIGSGTSGHLRGYIPVALASGTTATYTSGTPTVGGVYSTINQLIGQDQRSPVPIARCRGDEALALVVDLRGPRRIEAAIRGSQWRRCAVQRNRPGRYRRWQRNGRPHRRSAGLHHSDDSEHVRRWIERGQDHRLPARRSLAVVLGHQARVFRSAV